MSFGFRKSFTSGPFRMSFSKSGLSVSVGAGGARLTSGPRGTHVSFSKGGFYYRTRLDRPGRANTDEPVSPMRQGTLETTPTPVAAPSVEATQAIPTPQVFGDTTPDAVIEAMNRRITRRNYAFPAGIVIAGGLLAASAPWPIVAVAGVLATVCLAVQHSRSKYSSLVYGYEMETAERLKILHKAVATLCSADCLWSVREANISNGLTAHPLTLSRAQIGGEPPTLPKYLRTNITPAALQLNDGVLYFFPDRLFVWHSGRFAAIDYSALKLRFSRVTFLERESQPADAVVESQMPRSLSKEGTIPVLYYGLVDVSAASAFQGRLMTSRVESGENFVVQMRAITGGAEPTGREDANEPQYTHFDARVPLFYDLTDDWLKRFQALRSAFAIIQRCDYVWAYEGDMQTDDWKRNAGANTLVTRSRLYPRIVDQSPGFDSNAAFGICFGQSTLFLLPDDFVLGTGDRYQSLGKNLTINAGTTDFRDEDASPRDAELIGNTWRYVNKSGGPDRRFNDNRQIPIYRYGQLEIGCGSWRIRLCLSQGKASTEFETAIKSAMSGLTPNAQTGRTEVPPSRPPIPPSILASALSILGLSAGASLDQATVAYLSSIIRSGPLRSSNLAHPGS
jgi:hypothetical protein